MHKPVAEIKLLGGHPVLDFINTVDSRRDRSGPEYLTGYLDFIEWSERIGLIAQPIVSLLIAKAKVDPKGAQRAFSNALELREALYGLLMIEAADAPLPLSELALVNTFVHAANMERRLEPDAGMLVWSEGDPASFDSIAYRLALLGAEFLADRHNRRAVRECTGPNCGWLFLDRSRGGKRRWCSDKTCGTAMRVRRFRADGL